MVTVAMFCASVFCNFDAADPLPATVASLLLDLWKILYKFCEWLKIGTKFCEVDFMSSQINRRFWLTKKTKCLKSLKRIYLFLCFSWSSRISSFLIVLNGNTWYWTKLKLSNLLLVNAGKCFWNLNVEIVSYYLVHQFKIQWLNYGHCYIL